MRNLVVGVDGAPPSLRALEWAVDTVGTAWPDPRRSGGVAGDRTGGGSRSHGAPDISPAAAGRARNGVDRAVRARVGTVTAVAINGSAADALAEVAGERQADAIVVGAHVPVRTMPKTIGTTIRHLLKTSEHPLVVVPHEFSGGLADNGVVIVGIGHGPATDAAVHWAARLADDRDLPVGLVRATGEGPVFQVDGLLSLLAYYIDPSKCAEWTSEDLADFAEEVQSMTDHELAVGVSAPSGPPAVRLVDASTTASLLVIGHHRSIVTGHPHATQPLRHALTHARCPVAVIPADERSES